MSVKAGQAHRICGCVGGDAASGGVHRGDHRLDGLDRVRRPGRARRRPVDDEREISDHFHPAPAARELAQRQLGQPLLGCLLRQQRREVPPGRGDEPAGCLQPRHPRDQVQLQHRPARRSGITHQAHPADSPPGQHVQRLSPAQRDRPAGPPLTAGWAWASTRPGATYRPASRSAPGTGSLTRHPAASTHRSTGRSPSGNGTAHTDHDIQPSVHPASAPTAGLPTGALRWQNTGAPPEHDAQQRVDPRRFEVSRAACRSPPAGRGCLPSPVQGHFPLPHRTRPALLPRLVHRASPGPDPG